MPYSFISSDGKQLVLSVMIPTLDIESGPKISYRKNNT